MLLSEYSKNEEIPYILQYINEKTGEVSEEFNFFTLERAKDYYEQTKDLIKDTKPRYLYYNAETDELKIIKDAKVMMRIKVEQDEKELLKASGNYIEDMGCYEVEIIKNEKGHDTTYRIEMADEQYIDITVSELNTLKQILNNKSVSYLLGLEG